LLVQLGLADDDHVSEIARWLRTFATSSQWTVRDQHLGPAIVEKILVVWARIMVLIGTGTAPIFIAPKKLAANSGRIVEQEQDAVFHLHAKGAQGVSHPVDLLRHLAIGERASLTAQGDTIGAPGFDMSIDELVSSVEDVWELDA
jgi:hypothetical protein